MSSFVWIDHSEKQRRQVLEAIDVFREKDTRDELGLAGIRDAIAEALFPGTGTQQTRARYFFFVPWTVRRYTEGRGKMSDSARKIRAEELGLIDILADSETPRPRGIIGIEARTSLQRCPSSIYWNGLKALRICTSPYSLGDYIRYAERSKNSPQALLDDDRNVVSGGLSVWPGSLPNAPDNFPNGVRIDLTAEEAGFLKQQVIAQRPDSLFAFFVREGVAETKAPFAWDQPEIESAPTSLRARVNLARVFAEVMEGAPIIYNFALTQMEPVRVDLVENCEGVFDEWCELMDARQPEIEGFVLGDFWTFVHGCGAPPRVPTRLFVERWFTLATDPVARVAMKSDPRARNLIFAREQEIKGQMARSLEHNRRARELAQGAAGLGRMDYRWATARTYLNDIAEGLKRASHA